MYFVCGICLDMMSICITSLANFLTNVSTLFANKSGGKKYFPEISFFLRVFLSVMRNVCMIFHMMMRKDFFPQLSNSIIEYSCRIFCMKIVCYYYCIIFVYQQQQRGSFFNMILGYMLWWRL